MLFVGKSPQKKHLGRRSSRCAAQKLDYLEIFPRKSDTVRRLVNKIYYFIKNNHQLYLGLDFHAKLAAFLDCFSPEVILPQRQLRRAKNTR